MARTISALLSFLLGTSIPCNAADRLFVADDWLDRYELPSTAPIRVLPPLSGAGSLSGACSPAGLLYYGFAALTRSTIRIWDQDGGSHVEVPLPTWAEPHGVAFDPAGNFYINSRSGDGAYFLEGGDPTKVPFQLVPPFNRRGAGAAIVAGGPHAGALLLGGFTSHNVFISEPPGALARLFIDGSVYPTDNSLTALTTNACGEVFVVVCSGSGKLCSVDRWDPEGVAPTRLATGFLANALEFDSTGILYISDGANGRVLRLTPDLKLDEFINSSSTHANIVMCRAPLACAAGGPYREECQGVRTCVALHAGPRPDCAEYAWTSDCPGADFGGTEGAADATLCFDTPSCSTTCRAWLEMKEGIFRSAACASEITVEDTRPPVLRDVPADETADCDRVPPPARPLTEDRCDPVPSVGFAESREDGRCPGEYRLLRSWVARDDCGNETQAEQLVSVIDRGAPVVAPGGEDLGCLWPPNHRMVCFDSDDFAVDVADACSGPSTWRFVGCASDQPDDADETDPGTPWGGDGRTVGDCQVADEGRSLCVRAERAGHGPGASEGRRYRIEVEALDACGNASAPTAIGFLHVPHNQDRSEARCRPGSNR